MIIPPPWRLRMPPLGPRSSTGLRISTVMSDSPSGPGTWRSSTRTLPPAVRASESNPGDPAAICRRISCRVSSVRAGKTAPRASSTGASSGSNGGRMVVAPKKSAAVWSVISSLLRNQRGAATLIAGLRHPPRTMCAMTLSRPAIRFQSSRTTTCLPGVAPDSRSAWASRTCSRPW